MHLYQYLGVFLVNFNMESNAGNQYVEAFIPSIMAVTGAPMSSPLASLSTDKLVKFLTHVTSPHVTRNPHLHQNLARLLVTEIENDINNIKCNIIYSKTLTMLDIYQAGQEFVDIMLNKCEDILCVSI